MKPDVTVIQLGGVFRCCHESLSGQMDEEKQVSIGEHISCGYCKQEFILTAPVSADTGASPMWKPVGL